MALKEPRRERMVVLAGWKWREREERVSSGSWSAWRAATSWM
jgi:hypothetical protein